MLRIVIIAGLLLTGTPAKAETPSARPSLKPAATIAGDLVHIGDLVEGAGAHAGVAIFRAPDLGTSGPVSVARVREALRPYGLGDVDAGDLAEVVVSRPSRAITAREIESRIAQALAGQRGLGAPDDLKLTLDQTLRIIHIEADATAELQVVRLALDSYGSRFSIVLDVPGSALLRRTPLRLSGRVTETAEIAVLTRPLQRGDIVRPGDLAIERRPRAEVGPDGVGRFELAMGLAARRPLRAGQPLRIADLMKPELVKRNETVTLLYQVPGILLTIRGQATEAGAEGDTIGVLNLQSKRTVHGTVTGSGQVTVTGSLGTAVPARSASLSAPADQPQPE